MLAVCHTVIPDRDDGKPNGGIIYHAASPGMCMVSYVSPLLVLNTIFLCNSASEYGASAGTEGEGKLIVVIQEMHLKSGDSPTTLS